jgi:hypothetical protein
VSTLSSKARFTRDILVEAGIHTQPDSPASGLLTALCPAGAGIFQLWDVAPRRAQVMASIAAEPCAEAPTALWRRVGGAIEVLTQPARERGDDTGVIFE